MAEKKEPLILDVADVWIVVIIMVLAQLGEAIFEGVPRVHDHVQCIAVELVVGGALTMTAALKRRRMRKANRG